MEKREQTLARRHARQEQPLSEHTRTLPPNRVLDLVSIQNQHGPHPMKWDKSGTVVEVMGYDQYKIRVDGSGMISIRNRKFQRKIIPFNSTMRPSHSLPLEQAPSSAHNNLPHSSPGSPTQGQARGDPIPYVPAEPEIEVGNALQKKQLSPGNPRRIISRLQHHLPTDPPGREGCQASLMTT